MSPRSLGEIRIESGVSAFTGEGFVTTHALDSAGDFLGSGQLTPAEAMEHALAIIEAASAARHDAALWSLLKEKIGLEDEACAVFLSELRERRKP